MKTTARIAGISGLALAAAALAVPASASASTAGSIAPTSTAHAPAAAIGQVFVQTDNLAGNTVVAYDRSATGALTQAGVYPTGGLGGQLVGSMVDHTASEGSLALDRAHGLLYAVNAGSDTITVFSVHGDALQRRQILHSGGSFPVSIAVHGDAVYVLNARGGGVVQGYRRVGQGLVRVHAWSRALGLDDTVTPEFTHTPGQIAFTPDGAHLLVTTKAAANTIDVFAVTAGGGLSAAPVVNDDAGAVPFGLAFDLNGHVAVAEAGTNAVATFSLDRTGVLTLITRAATGQAATCWIVGTGSKLYASNAGSGNVSGFKDHGSGALEPLGPTATDAGTVDAAASSDGANLYVQTGAAGIVDAFGVGAGGALTAVGSVTVPGAVGGEGIVAS